MPQSLANVLIHLIFSTKNREPVIPHDLTPTLHGYIVGARYKPGKPCSGTRRRSRNGVGQLTKIAAKLARKESV